MKYLSILLFPFIIIACAQSEEDINNPETALYFPPIGSNVWEIQSPASLGWNEAKIAELDAFMVNTSTRPFLYLKMVNWLLKNTRESNS